MPRLERAIRANAAGDLAGQVALLAVALLWVRSPWMFAVWGVRWLVLAAILVAWRASLTGRDEAAAVILVSGHAVGALAAVAILPEFVPVIVFSIFGDLQLATGFNRRLVRPVLTGCVAAAGLVGALSLQSWTGLAQQAPPWVLYATLVVHSAASGALAVRQSREGYFALQATADELGRVSMRFRQAAEDERADVGLTLAAGPGADLDRLVDGLDGIVSLLPFDPQAASAAADRQADAAQRSLTALRAISHGVFPESLRLHGLGPALATLLAQTGPGGQLAAAEGRFPPEVEAAAYACVLDLVRTGGSDAAPLDVTVTTVESWLSVVVTRRSQPGAERCGDGPAVLRSADRVRALGGTITFGDHGGNERLVADIPLAPQVGDALSGPGSDAASDPGPVPAPTGGEPGSAVLARFLTVSVRLCQASIVLVAAVGLATGLAWVALVEITLVAALGLLVAARRAARAGRYRRALALVCVQTWVAGAVVTLFAPRFVPVTALIVALPIVLSLPYTGRRTLDLLDGLQAGVLAVVTILSVAGTAIVSPTPLPFWITAVAVPAATMAAAALGAVTVLATYDELEAQTRALARSLRALVAATDEERRRLERDLHDGAQQHVVAASMQLRALARLATADPGQAADLARRLRTQLAGARAERRALTDGMLPAELVAGDLAAAAHRLPAWATLPVVVRAEKLPAVPTAVAYHVYYCCREAIQNATKHGGARCRVVVTLSATPDRLSFEVTDSGRGFDPARVAPGLGLRSLEERVAALGGTVEVRSTAGTGTTVSGVVPIP